MNKGFFLVLFILMTISCYSRPASSVNENDVSAVDSSELDYNVPVRYTLRFIATGDNLMHLSVLRAKVKDGVYDFKPIYTEIKDIIQKADVAFVNQETVMAGTSFGYTGYPVFNTPQSLAFALDDAGFNVINLANNHALDMRAAGLYSTLDFLDKFENFTVIGARRSGSSARIVTKNNIKLGFLAYTYAAGGTIPRDNPNLVSLINREVMAREIAALRPLCDFLIVSMHWGEEYRLQPDRDQTSLARFLAEQNVDLIIGHHPHVLQRVETITLPNGRKTICYYSLGNFISNQRERERLIGGVAVITFAKEGIFSESGEFTGEISIADVGILPVVSHFDLNISNYRVYPLYAYTKELIDNHGYKEFDPDGFTIDFFYSVLDRLQTKVYLESPF